jgi:hypothetical protein
MKAWVEVNGTDQPEYIDVRGALFPVPNGSEHQEVCFNLTWEVGEGRGYVGPVTSKDGDGTVYDELKVRHEPLDLNTFLFN